jgi:hypothetical protein
VNTRGRQIGLVLAVQLLSGCVVAAGSSRGGSGAGFLFLAMPFVVIMLFAMLVRRLMGRGGLGSTRRRVSEGAATAVNPHVLRAEVSVLADDVIRLEPQVALNDAARDDYEAATHRYRVAQVALDEVKDPADLARVQRVVDEANWSMSRARAILQGRPPPPPPRSLRRPGSQGEPAIDVDDRQQPVYVDSPASFQSGWFAAGGGLLGGLFLGGFRSGWIDEEEGGGVEENRDGSQDGESW